MGESARDGAQWLPSVLSFWELHSCKSCESPKPWLERQTSTKLGPLNTIRKVLKHRCLKRPCIVHVDLICMSHDQKKGQEWESNWEFDSWPQTPWKQGSNEFQLGHVIHYWKDIFEDYKILPWNFEKRFDLKKIWTYQNFWDNKSLNFGTITWKS